MGISPTLSQTESILAGTWPGKSYGGPRAATDFGIRTHAHLALLLEAGDEACYLRALALRETLLRFLTTNPYGVDWTKEATWGIEEAYAVNFANQSARSISKPNDRHEYTDRLPGELPGTIDFFALSNSKRLIVVDHKTGKKIPPLPSPQLLSYAGTLLYALGVGAVEGDVVLAYNHGPSDAPANVVHDPVTQAIIRQHMRDLAARSPV